MEKILFFFLATFLIIIKTHAQCDPLNSPGLFGPSTTSIFCKNEPIPIGVAISDPALVYYFSKYANGAESSRKGGPLAGSGNTLSVSTAMRSAADYGNYRVKAVNSCGDTASSGFYVFYGSIDNLSISSWGNSRVSFKWAACGPIPAVTYDYAVSTQSNPNLVPTASILNTTDTTATVLGLTSGTTYYIHVRLNSVIWNGNSVDPANFGSNCNNGNYTWQSIRFISCGGSSTTPPAITPANSFGCTGSNITLTAATGGSTYQWYREDNSVIAGATASVYTATSAGQYRVYITTAAVCQGMVSTATVTQAPIQTCLFSGSSGDFYAGDTIKFYFRNTLNNQTYKLLKDGAEVYSTQGIGDANESDGHDSIFYNFVITSAAQAGLYTVRITSPYCSSVDVAGGLAINYITGVTICPGASTSFTFSSSGNNTIFQWQVDAGSGFSPVTNVPGLYSGAATKTLNIINAPSTMYGYKYRCVCTGGTPVTSSTRTLKFGVAWLGTTSMAWNTQSNWTCGVAPNANTDVIVQPTVSPVPSTNLPVISVSTSCKSVLVKPGATLKVNSGVTLTITGP